MQLVATKLSLIMARSNCLFLPQFCKILSDFVATPVIENRGIKLATVRAAYSNG
jgi:hypothetical protein